jgi:hypothetical protein
VVLVDRQHAQRRSGKLRLVVGCARLTLAAGGLRRAGRREQTPGGFSKGRPEGGEGGYYHERLEDQQPVRAARLAGRAMGEEKTAWNFWSGDCLLETPRPSIRKKIATLSPRPSVGPPDPCCWPFRCKLEGPPPPFPSSPVWAWRGAGWSRSDRRGARP